MGAEWHYSKAGLDEKLGPVGTAELKAMASDGRLSPEDLIWREGQKSWVPARSAKGLFPGGGPPPLPQAETAPPPLPATDSPTSDDAQPKGWWAKFTSDKEPWDGGTLAGLIVGTVLIPLIGIAAGIFGLTKKAKKTQGGILLAVGIGVMALFLATMNEEVASGGGYAGGGSSSARAPVRAPAPRNQLPSGIHDAELWARVQRECSAMSHDQQLAAYKMLEIKKRTDRQKDEMRRMFAPIGQ